MSTIPTPSGQLIPGTSGDDFLGLQPTGFGLDTLVGLQGDDTLVGGLGSGYIFGGKGNDSLVGGATTNLILLFGDLGDDTITAGFGRLIANGGQGNDSIFGGSEGDSLRGGKDNDTIIGNLGRDTIYGDDGNDLIVGSRLGNNPGNDPNFLSGNQGNDTIYGGAGADDIYGGKGDDLINVDPMMLPEELREFVNPLHVAGDNNVWGGEGNDTIGWSASTGRNFYLGEAGNDYLIGGLGQRDDTVNRVRTNVADATATGGSAPITSAETGNDTLLGGDGNDTLVGSGGNNSLNGGAGNDSIVSGLDRDTLVGGTGADRFVYLDSVISYNQQARTDIGAVATETVANRLARADRILDFSTTESDVIAIQNTAARQSFYGGFDTFTGGVLDPLRVAAASVPGLNADAFIDPVTQTPRPPADIAATNYLALQDYFRGGVRATTQVINNVDSIVIYIENDITFLTGATPVAGLGITGRGTAGDPYTITGASNAGLTAGDTILAVLQAPAGATDNQVAAFIDRFEDRGAANFAFF